MSARRRVRRMRVQLRRIATDGMRLSAFGLGALAVAHHGTVLLVAVALGLFGICCARLSSSPVPRSTGPRGSVRPAGSRTGRQTVNLGSFSPECLDGDHALCSGVGCSDNCGHPGRTRSNSTRARRPASTRAPF